MPISTQQVQVAECDNCGTRKYSENGAKTPGVQGHLIFIDERGRERSIRFFSCRTDAGHIGKAAVNALNRKQDPDQTSSVTSVSSPLPVPPARDHSAQYPSSS